MVALRINEEIGIDGYLANDLMVRNGLLTGEVKVNVSFHNKDEALAKILPKWNLKMEDCISVGDDPTLIPLFKKVGFSVAFNPADENIERNVDVVVKSKDLRDILPHLLNKQYSNFTKKNTRPKSQGLKAKVS